MKVLVPMLIIFSVGGYIIWNRIKHQENVRRVVDPMKLKVPVFGPLFQKVAIARFSRNLGTMVRSGVPILQALDIVGDTTGNWTITAAVRDIQDSVRQGESLTQPLSQHEVFPPMVAQMLAVGEDTGALYTKLAKNAQFYDHEVEATTESLTALIEPIMIAVLGGLVGGMIICLYLPIFSVYNHIGS
jgi:type IV pilus assembly protein PilC